MAANPIRMARLQSPQGHIRMVPMDHGISIGPAPGIIDPSATLAAVAEHASCVTVHKGLIRHVAPFAPDLGLLLHLSASTDVAPDPNDKRLVATVEEALKLGFDGVSTHCNLGADSEAHMIESLGRVSTLCNDWGVPHIAMVYPRGPAIDNPFDPTLVAHAARLGAELGADVVKVPYTGSPDTFRDVVRGAGVPVVVAGGPKRDSFEGLLEALRGAKEAGAAGVSIGRNVFQHKNPGAAIQTIATIFP